MHFGYAITATTVGEDVGIGKMTIAIQHIVKLILSGARSKLASADPALARAFVFEFF
jgi:hypothetical protein